MNLRSVLLLLAIASPPSVTEASSRRRRQHRPQPPQFRKDCCFLPPSPDSSLSPSWSPLLSRSRSFSSSSSHPPSPGFIRRESNRAVVASSTRDLGTSYEWLAEERATSTKIDWFHPSSCATPDVGDDATNDADDENLVRMPLYPLSAVHVPYSGEDHTLINVEPRNVKMSRDLVDGKWDGSLFCVSLRAMDTNRIATVGTIMRLERAEEGRSHPTIDRVVVTCRAIGIGEVVSVENPSAWSEESEKQEYLVARVRARPTATDTSVDGNNNDVDSTMRTVLDDYRAVRSLYVNSQSLASNELPKFAVDAIKESMPELDGSAESYRENMGQLWKAIDAWQRLCNTIREAQRRKLNKAVNELSVDAAIRYSTGGPLELPVRRHTLPPEVRAQLDRMETEAAREFYESGMDPVLDFQEVLSATSYVDRVAKLAGMVSQERRRLEAKESLMKGLLAELEDDYRNGFD